MYAVKELSASCKQGGALFIAGSARQANGADFKSLQGNNICEKNNRAKNTPIKCKANHPKILLTFR
jgi:hypothetical protein